MITIPKHVAPVTPSVDRIGLSAKEAAKSLGVCERTLWTLTKTGQIPVARAGRKLVYSVDALKDFVNDNRR